MDLRDAVVIVTGASSGIGAATALRCAAEGAVVVLAARSASGLRRVHDQIEASGGSALPLPTDVSDDESVQRLAAAVIERFGRADALVNCAGFGVFEAIQQASFEDLQAMMQVNLYGSVRCIQAFLPHMLARRRGQIVNLASVAGLLATPNLGFYSATKFALVGLTRSLQLDLHGSGVRCALVCPHIVRTPFFQRADLAKVNRIASLLPWLNADDVGRAIVRAIRRGGNGDVVVPAIGRPLLALASALPGLAKLIMRVLG